MIKKLLILFVIYTLVALTMACPSGNSIEKAKQSSAKLAAFANEGVNVTRNLFRENVISLEQKDRIADGFILLAKSGVVFDLAVKNIQKTYGANVPQNEIKKLFTVFNLEVVAKFVEVLKLLKVVGKDNAAAEIIALLQTAILTIAKAFSNERSVKLQIEGAMK